MVRRIGTVAMLGLLLMLALAAPAAAAHKTSHDAGSAVTENDDSDGVANNLPDEGDNMHPSGKDRSVENGGSGDQGSTNAIPDQDGHGPERDTNGTDQPDGSGGGDILDQDRNNGCGNDDDFDDDSEGHCRKRTGPSVTETPRLVPLVPPEVLGETISRPGASVLGITVVREAAALPATLALTGTHVGGLLMLGLGSLMAGLILLALGLRPVAVRREI